MEYSSRSLKTMVLSFKVQVLLVLIETSTTHSYVLTAIYHSSTKCYIQVNIKIINGVFDQKLKNICFIVPSSSLLSTNRNINDMVTCTCLNCNITLINSMLYSKVISKYYYYI